jgi:hypothetical protein
LPVLDEFLHPIYKKGVKTMPNRNQNEYQNQTEYGNLDQRKDLTGPSDPNKHDYPKRPQHVAIEQEQSQD